MTNFVLDDVHAANNMDPVDWKYEGEGGKNAVFAYRPGGEASEIRGPDEQQCWDGRLLRVEKADIARSGAAIGDSTEEEEDGALERRTTDHDDSFREMVRQILQPFADKPAILHLDWHFLSALRSQALESDQIPPRRLKDWLADDKEKRHRKQTPIGLLLWDYRLALSLGRRLPTCVSIEVKPKAGYKAFSPLVEQSRKAKFLRSRYVLLQQLYAEGKCTRDWMDLSETQQASSYDPLDLFSGDVSRIKRALGDLMDSPQNNLTIRVGDAVVLGNSQGGNHSSIGWELVRQALNLCENDNCQSHLVDLTAAVLFEEDFLPRLLALQKLDILDADGALCVYGRLLDLCGGSQDAAETVLDSGFKIAMSSTVPLHSILRASPLEPPSDNCANLSRLCDEVEKLSCLLETASPSLPEETELDRLRNRAADIAANLSLEDCRYLLQTWLLSLSMCDLSFFVTFHALSFEDSIALKKPSAVSGSGMYRIHSRQKEGSPGTLLRRLNENDSEAYVLYQLKAIDFDRKAARKLKTRHRKESLFDNTVR